MTTTYRPVERVRTGSFNDNLDNVLGAVLGREESEMDGPETKRPDIIDEEDGQVVRLRNWGVAYDRTRKIFCSSDITLTSVNLRNQTFSVEMDMRFYWRQPEIADGVPANATWTIYDDGLSLPVDPDDLFEYDEEVKWIQQEFHYHPGGVVEWQCQFNDTFSERMELGRFPVDRQFLNILLQARVDEDEGNWFWVSTPPKWVPPKRRYLVRARLGQSISDYQLFSPWADFRVLPDANDPSGIVDEDSNLFEEQPPFKLRLRVQRYTSFYIGNIVMPMFFIIVVSFCSFVIPPTIDRLQDRTSVTITSMLAGVAFRYTVSQMLPPVNYLTWLDYYVMAAFLSVSFFICENAVAALVEDQYGHGRLVDFYFGGLLLLIWPISNLFMVYTCLTNTFRLSWEDMDRMDRQPSEIDEYHDGLLQDCLGPAGDDDGEKEDGQIMQAMAETGGL